MVLYKLKPRALKNLIKVLIAESPNNTKLNDFFDLFILFYLRFFNDTPLCVKISDGAAIESTKKDKYFGVKIISKVGTTKNLYYFIPNELEQVSEKDFIQTVENLVRNNNEQT